MIVRVEIGQRFVNEMPWSEACMSMGVADKVMEVELIPCGRAAMAQLYQDGRHYSFPITTGEAGVYQDHEGYYVTYPGALEAKGAL